MANNNKGSKGSNSKAMASAIEGIALTIAPATVVQQVVEAVQAPAVTPVTTVTPLQRYVAISLQATPIGSDDAGNAITYANKRAFAIALYEVCSKHLGYAVASNSNSAAFDLAARLLPHANVGFSRKTGTALRGQELTQKGMTGYVKGFCNGKPEAWGKLRGEAHHKVEAEMKGAKLCFTLYAKEEGLAGYEALCKVAKA